jgi:hypothetical protein
LLGFEDPLTTGDVYDCLRFEMDFDSRIEDVASTGPVQETTTSVVKVEDMPITSLGVTNVNVFQGEGPTRNMSVTTQTNALCSVGYSNFRDGQFQAANLDVHIQTRPDSLHPFGASATVKEVVLLYDPGQPTETFTLACPKVPPTSYETSRWRGLYSILHQNEYHQSGGVFIMPLNPGANGVIGTKGYNRTADCSYEATQATCKEETVITVYHRPK